MLAPFVRHECLALTQHQRHMIEPVFIEENFTVQKIEPSFIGVIIYALFSQKFV